MLLAALLAGVAAMGTPPHCHSGDLRLVSAGSQGAAGTMAEQLRLEPRRGVVCTLRGYPGVDLIGTSGQSLGIHVGHLRDDLHPVRTLNFSRTHPARFDIRHPSFDRRTTKPCGHKVTAVRIIPPNQTRAHTVRLDRPFPRFCTAGARVTPVGRRY